MGGDRAGTSARRAFRADIEGLRAVAIALVVAYHAGLRSVPGGYVGVDVFFVISGFLITDHLLGELRTEGRLSFGAFYARRARRLLPSAMLVLGVTVVVSAIVLPPLEAVGVAKDGLANAFYVGNYRFALQATNYLSVSGPVSPLLNYWSLGVEEQFYLVWPAVLVGASLVWWRTRRPLFSTVALVLAGAAAASFGASLWLTRADQPWAFFSLGTRAWELAVGGLVALAVPRLRRLPGLGAAVLAWAGLATIAWSAHTFTSSTPYPGAAALVPVLGAATVVAAGCRGASSGAVLLLGRRPFQSVGRVSYTWYLWHWPVLILAPSVVGHVLDIRARLVACGLSLALAAVTSATVERPLQRARWLRRPRQGLVMALGLSAAVAATVALAMATLPPITGHGTVATTKLVTHHVERPGDGTSRPRADPALVQADDLTAQVQAAVSASVGTNEVPANLSPSLSGASSDEAPPFYDGCFDGFTDATVHPCDYGDVAAPPSKTVVLFGDSHALMWFPALQNLANQSGWHLIAQAKATCPPIDVSIFSPDLGEQYWQCDQWKAAVVARIRALRPALVVLGFSREYGQGNDHVVVDGPAWMQGLAQMITSIRSAGSRVVVMGDVPYPQSGVVADCLSAHLSDATACAIPKSPPAFNAAGVGQEKAVTAAAGASYIDTEPWFCAASTCAVIVDNLLVYRDDNHITATYASWLTPVVGADLEVASGGLFGT